MGTDAVRFSVVVCTYSQQRWDGFMAAVESVRRQHMSPAEIIVVVDHNDDLLERVAKEAPDVLAVGNLGCRGLSDARNAGVACARGDVIAFLDDDAVAEPDWLEVLSTGYDRPHVVGVGGSAHPIWSEGRPAWFPDEFDWVVGCSYKGMPTTAAPVRNLIGCNMSFKKEVFQAVGGFTVGLGRLGTRPVGCEETELCIRVAQRLPGSTILFDPRARVHHLVPASRSQWSYFRSRCYAEGLSKAAVSTLVGREQGLSAERSYTKTTLPKGLGRGLTDGLRGDTGGFARAGVIVAGAGIAALGYGRGRLVPQPFTQAAVVTPA